MAVVRRLIRVGVFAGLVMASSCFARGDIVSGLRAFYPFSGTVVDESGFGHHGTLQGPVFASDRFGAPASALSFDGNNDSVNVADSALLDISSAITLAAWINPSEQKSQEIIHKGMNVAAPYGLSLSGTNDIVFSLNVGGQRLQQRKTQYALNEWSFLAATYDGSSMRLYVDGVLEGQRGASGSLGTNTQPLLIGTRLNIPSSTFHGLIDDVRIYSRALSTQDILELYNLSTLPEEELAVIWTGETSGTWNNENNWTPHEIPNNGRATVTLGSNPATTIVLDLDARLAGLRFDSENDYDISCDTPSCDGGTLNLAASEGQAHVDVWQGRHLIRPTVLVNSDLTVSVSSGASLQLDEFTIAASGLQTVKTGAGQLVLNSNPIPNAFSSSHHLDIQDGEVTLLNGYLGDITNSGGTLRIGNLVGAQNFTQSDSGRLDIGPLSLGRHLPVSGTATLSGELQLEAGDFVSSGMTFQALTVGQRIGTFDRYLGLEGGVNDDYDRLVPHWEDSANGSTLAVTAAGIRRWIGGNGNWYLSGNWGTPRSGSIIAEISNGANVSLSINDDVGVSEVISGLDIPDGTLNVAFPGMKVRGDVSIGTAGYLANSSVVEVERLEVGAGGVLEVGASFWVYDRLKNWDRSTGTLQGGTIIVRSKLDLPATHVIRHNAARLELHGSGEIVRSETSLLRFLESNMPEGDLVLNDNLFNVLGTFRNEGTVTVENHGEFRADAYTQAAGTTTLDNGTIFADSSAITITGGSMRGNGNLISQVVVNQATMSPGRSPGVLQVEGDYLQADSGTLEIEVGGLSPGQQHDQLIVTGDATLAGGLDLALINGFVPAAGDAVTFLTAANVVGRFDRISSRGVPDQLAIAIDYAPTRVDARFVTPVPVAYDASSFGGDWSSDRLWGGEIPNSTSLISISNTTNVTQTVSVDVDAFADRLNLSGVTEMQLAVDRGRELSITHEVSLGANSLLSVQDGGVNADLIDMSDASLAVQTGGTIRLGSELRLAPTSAYQLTGGTLDVGSGQILGADEQTLQFSDGTLQNIGQLTGALVQRGGTLRPSSDGLGTMEIQGLYELRDGTLELTIGGDVPVSQIAGIDSCQMALGGGTLDIRFQPDVTLLPGTFIELISDCTIVTQPREINLKNPPERISRVTFTSQAMSISSCVVGDFNCHEFDEFGERKLGIDDEDAMWFITALTNPGALPVFASVADFDMNGRNGLNYEDIPCFVKAYREGVVDCAASDALTPAAAFAELYRVVGIPETTALWPHYLLVLTVWRRRRSHLVAAAGLCPAAATKWESQTAENGKVCHQRDPTPKGAEWPCCAITIVAVMSLSSSSLLASCTPPDPSDDTAQIWLQSAVFPATAADVPVWQVPQGSVRQQLEIWGRPVPGQTIQAFSLNLRSSVTGVVQFSSVDLIDWPDPDGAAPTKRFDSANVAIVGSDLVARLGGLYVLNEDGRFVGVGPRRRADDPGYDRTNNAWQLATVLYDVVGEGETDLFLQIGDRGIWYEGQRRLHGFRVALGSADDILFLSETDEEVNCLEIDSAHPDATIRVTSTLPNSDLDDDGSVDAADAGLLFASWSRSDRQPVDLNGDGFVDADDAGGMFAIWNRSGPADFNLDGTVDAADAGAMFAAWGTIVNPDLNRDGTIDAADAGIMFSNWTGDAVRLPLPVPEPSSNAVMIFAGILLSSLSRHFAAWISSNKRRTEDGRVCSSCPT